MLNKSSRPSSQARCRASEWVYILCLTPPISAPCFLQTVLTGGSLATMATLSSWNDDVAAPAAPAPAADKSKPTPKKLRAAQPAARSDAAPARPPSLLGLVPKRGEAEAALAAGPAAAARAGVGGGGGGGGDGGGNGGAEKKKAYNPGRYVRVSNQSSYEAELFASSMTKSEAVPVVLSKNKLLANEILAPQFAKVSPRPILVGKPGAGKHAPDQSLPQKKKQATAAPVYETLQDSVDDLVLKQLGLDAYGNPTRTRQQKLKSPKRAAAYNESSQWKSDGHFIIAALSTDQGLVQSIAKQMADQGVAPAHDSRARHLGDAGASQTRKHDAQRQHPLDLDDQHGQRHQQHDYRQQQQQLQWTEVHAWQHEQQQKGNMGYGASIAGISQDTVHPAMNAASWGWPNGAALVHGGVPSACSPHHQGLASGDVAQPGPRQSYPQGNHPSTVYLPSQHYPPSDYPHHYPQHPQQAQGTMYPSQPAHQSLPHHPHHQVAVPHGQHPPHFVPTGAAGLGGGWQYVRKEGERVGAAAEGASEQLAGATAHEVASVPTVPREAADRPGAGSPVGVREDRGDGAGRAMAVGEAQRLSREEMAKQLAVRMENSTVDFLSAGFGRPGGGAPLGTAFGGNHYGQRPWPQVPPALRFQFGSTGAPGIGGGGVGGGGGGREGVEEGPRWGRRRVDPSEWGLERQEASPGQAGISEKERKREELRREWEEQIAVKQSRLEAERAAQRLREAAWDRNAPDFGSIPLGAVTKDGVWLGDKGGQGLRGPSTPFRKTKDAALSPAKNSVPAELLNKESQLQSRHVNPDAPRTSHSLRRSPPLDGGGEEDAELDGAAGRVGGQEGLGDRGGSWKNTRKGPQAPSARPKNTVPEELLSKDSKLLSHHVRGPTPPDSGSLDSFQVPATPVAQTSHTNLATQSQRISTGAARISTGASMQGPYGGLASPTPRQQSPGSRPVSIMSSPGRRIRNHRVSFQGPSDEPQPETPPLSPAEQGGGGKRVAFNTSEMLGHTGPQGWTSRPGAMLPETSGRDCSLPDERPAFGTPLLPPGEGAVSALLKHAPQHAGGANPGDIPQEAIKVYRRADGQAGARVDRGLATGGDAMSGVRRSKDAPSPGPGAYAPWRRMGDVAGEGAQGGRLCVGAGGARGPRPSVESNSGPHAKGSRDPVRGGQRRGGRLPETSKADARRRGAGNGRAAQNDGARRRDAGSKGREVPAESEEMVFDNHEPSIISATSRLIFYTGPSSGTSQTQAPDT